MPLSRIETEALNAQITTAKALQEINRSLFMLSKNVSALTEKLLTDVKDAIEVNA